MGYFVNEITTVCQYAIINFRYTDGTIFKAKRCMIGESVELPILTTDMNGILNEDNDLTFTFTGDWKNSSNQIVTNVIADDAYDYFSDIYHLEMYKWVQMETEADDSQSMYSDLAYDIIANKKIYLTNVSYQGYVIRPTIVYGYTNSGEIKHSITFTIDNLVDNPGQTTVFEPEFIVYKDLSLTQQIGTIKLEIRIYHSSEQPIE